MQSMITSFFAKGIQNQIAKDVANVKYFSVLADETCNKGHIEELALFIPLVKNSEIYEEFLYCIYSIVRRPSF